VLKSREHLAAVKSVGEMMTLQTMRFAHEIVDAGSLNLPKAAELSKKEFDLANMLIDSMSDKFDASKYKDDYYDKVLEVIQMKVAGVAPQAAAPKGPGPAKVIDLMEILKQSLSETKKGRGGRTSELEEATVVAGDSKPAKPKARKVR
jgi:DNA end-binding protein Ku